MTCGVMCLVDSKKLTIKTATGIDIIPFLQEILRFRLYVPTWSAQPVFSSIVRNKTIRPHYETPIDELAIAVAYKGPRPIAWIFYRGSVVWSFTKLEHRKSGINRMLLDSFGNPFYSFTRFAHPHPKWLPDGPHS